MVIENKDNLEVFENKEKAIEKMNCINDKGLIVEINLAEVPIFSCAKNPKTYTVETLINNRGISENAMEILNAIYNENKNAKVDYRSWKDSKGVKRELIISSEIGIPDTPSMDVFFALICILIKNNSPIYKLRDKYNFVRPYCEFTIAEICKILNKKPGKETYKSIREALRKLTATKYWSIGSIYNKNDSAYIGATENAISLLSDLKLSAVVYDEEKKKNKRVKGKAYFGQIIMDNFELGFFRILQNKKYFELKNGLTRGVYIYIMANKSKSTEYIKRDFNILKNKVPIEYKYKSELKIKLKPVLKNLIENKIITDYIYGDETIINDKKENCIYFIFKGSADDLKKKLELKEVQKKLKPVDENVFELVFPTDIRKELMDLGLTEEAIEEALNNKKGKYEVVKCILYVKERISKENSGKENATRNPAGLLRWVLNSSSVNLEKSAPHIHKFVEDYKNKVDKKLKLSEEDIKNKYEKYIQDLIKDFKNNDEVAYNIVEENVLTNLNSVADKSIGMINKGMFLAESESEKQKIAEQLKPWEEFIKKQKESNKFKEEFIKEFKLYKLALNESVMDFSEFRNKYITNNK